MEQIRVKTGITALDILAVVFTPLGGMFVLIGIIMELNIEQLIENGTGDVEMLPVIFGIVGAPFLILGVIFAFLAIRKRKTARQVVRGGYYMMADIVNVWQNYNVRVNGVCPFILECHYQDPATGTLHVFRSRNLFYCPAELVGQQVRVYVEQGNMRHYYVYADPLISNVRMD